MLGSKPVEDEEPLMIDQVHPLAVTGKIATRADYAQPKLVSVATTQSADNPCIRVQNPCCATFTISTTRILQGLHGFLMLTCKPVGNDEPLVVDAELGGLWRGEDATDAQAALAKVDQQPHG